MLKGNSDISFVKKDGCRWYPVFTLPKNEKKMQGYFQRNGIPSYLPMKKHININPVLSKGRNYTYKRVLHVPMFSNYLFANLDYSTLQNIKYERSVIRVLDVADSFEDKLLEELNIIRKLELFSEENEMGILANLTKGKRVKFIHGMFEGCEGVVDYLEENDMVHINITSIDSSVAISYPAVWCQPLDA